jgi:hypothetical protein
MRRARPARAPRRGAPPPVGAAARLTLQEGRARFAATSVRPTRSTLTLLVLLALGAVPAVTAVEYALRPRGGDAEARAAHLDVLRGELGPLAGFVSTSPATELERVRAYYLAQYVLAPTVLRPVLAQPTSVGDAPAAHPAADPLAGLDRVVVQGDPEPAIAAELARRGFRAVRTIPGASLLVRSGSR